MFSSPSPHESPPLIVIAGPTAVGKTVLALALAEELDGEIVAADSLQVYRYLDIGTAKPSLEDRQRVPHHLIDVVDPDESFTAKDYEQLALQAIGNINRRGKLPILVGGTGLYIRALLYGIFPGPGEDPALRSTLYREAQELGPEGFHRRLQEVDPEAASKIHPHDLFRIVRALEVYLLTGRPISEHQKDHRRPQLQPIVYIGLKRKREVLYRLIEERVDRMIEKGLLQEVEGLLRMGYTKALKPMQSLGYRHLIEHLEGIYSLDQAVALFKRDSRRYAKRQMTWFTKEEGIEWAEVEGSNWVEALVFTIKKRVEKTLAKG